MRRKRRIRNRRIKFFMALCCIVCFLCGFTFRGSITTAYADSESGNTKDKSERVAEKNFREDIVYSAVYTNDKAKITGQYYTSIVVETGDSLYSIASKYYTEDYGSIGNYISEIKKVNGLRSDYICQGSYLTIPYYGEL